MGGRHKTEDERQRFKRDIVTAEGREREDRLRRSYILTTLNGKVHNSNMFYLNQQIPERAN